MSKLGNEPACTCGPSNDIFPGETIRQKYVRAAMQGLLSNSALLDTHDSNTMKWVAEHAASQADACLAEEARTR